MLDAGALTFQPWNMLSLLFRLSPCFLLIISASLLTLSFSVRTYALNIEPSKYQGGTTNVIPNKSDGAPSLLSFRWLFGPGHSSAMDRVKAPPEFNVSLATFPTNFIPGSNAVLTARMTVINQGKDKYILNFETAQHFDFVIRKTDGVEIYRTSADKIYAEQHSSIVINKGEKLVYSDEIFSPTNQVTHLVPGEYRLIGRITSKVPISVETSFRVAP